MELLASLYIRLREAASRSYRGQTMTEYALVVVFIAIALVEGYQLIGGSLVTSVSNVSDAITSA